MGSQGRIPAATIAGSPRAIHTPSTRYPVANKVSPSGLNPGVFILETKDGASAARVGFCYIVWMYCAYIDCISNTYSKFPITRSITARDQRATDQCFKASFLHRHIVKAEEAILASFKGREDCRTAGASEHKYNTDVLITTDLKCWIHYIHVCMIRPYKSRQC